MSASNMPKYLYVSYFPSVLILSWFGSSIPTVMCRLPLLLLAWYIFLSQIPSLCPDCTFSLRVLEFPVLFHFFFANSLMSSMYIMWLIFSCNLLSLYPAVHFLSKQLSGIIAIIYSNAESASPWSTFLCSWLQLSFSLLLSIVLFSFSWISR